MNIKTMDRQNILQKSTDLIEELYKNNRKSKISYLDKSKYDDFKTRVEELYKLNYFLSIRPFIKKIVQQNYHLENHLILIDNIIYSTICKKDVCGELIIQTKFYDYYKDDLAVLIDEYILFVIKNIESNTLELKF